MKIKNIIFPLSKHNEFLSEKWWHRLFVVFYFVGIASFLVIAFFISVSSIGEHSFNITVKNNLRDFSKQNNSSIANTVPLFLEQSDKIGCLENNNVKYVSTYTLENETFCSADIPSHLDEAANKIIGNGTLSVEQRRDALSQMLAKDTEKRYCFVPIVPNSLDCSSDKVIAYNRNTIFYLQAIIYTLIASYIFSLILQVIYFKGLIYIIYGRKVNSK